jgi:hypothetical protein
MARGCKFDVAHIRAGRNMRHAARSGTLDTEMPPIERVQGPYIKGVRICARLHKTTGVQKVN